jgi:hypothetical protein
VRGVGGTARGGGGTAPGGRSVPVAVASGMSTRVGIGARGCGGADGGLNSGPGTVLTRGTGIGVTIGESGIGGRDGGREGRAVPSGVERRGGGFSGFGGGRDTLPTGRGFTCPAGSGGGYTRSGSRRGKTGTARSASGTARASSCTSAAGIHSAQPLRHTSAFAAI